MRLLFLSALTISLIHSYDFIRHTQDLESSRFFDTSFISKYPEVKKVLINEEGFTEVFFDTPAGHKLQGLVRTVQNPDFSIIFCSGFLPGKQEGIATFITMMPKNCNILFFNGHGKGKSTGLLSFMNLKDYGRYDYLDTIGAIDYMHSLNNGPLFIHGICAGAFHAAHALLQLKHTVYKYNIRGLVFDSAWSSVEQVMRGVITDIQAHTQSSIAHAGLKVGDLFACYVASPVVQWHAHETDLENHIQNLNIPVLFIHSKDDTLARFDVVERLSKKVKKPTCWWIDKPSKHGCHHLKHKDEYANRLAEFCSKQL